MVCPLWVTYVTDMLAHNEPILTFIISTLQESQNYLHGNTDSFELIMFISHFIYNEHFIYFNQILHHIQKYMHARRPQKRSIIML